MVSVTVIMATYNGERYVKEQIVSIMKSDYQNIILHVYDDGSTDQTIRIIKECQEEYPDKILLTQNEKNLGVSMNFLTALTKVTTQYAMFCDQDDVWMENKISKTLGRMMKTKDSKTKPVAVFTDVCVTDENLQVLQPSFHQSNHLDTSHTTLSYLLMENKLIGCTVMVNRPLIEKITEHPLPHYIRYHDWWVGLIAASFGTISYVKTPTMYYRQHEHNLVGDQNYSSYVKKRLKACHKLRDYLLLTQKQAAEFYQVYGASLGENAELVHRFAGLSKENYIRRRYHMIKFHYFKSGFVRNAGVFLFL